MREQMPVVCALIDDMRKVFGKDNIDAVMRDGMRGKPVFYATENGHAVGTPLPPPAAPGKETPKGRREMARERQYELVAEDRATSLSRSQQGRHNDNKGVK